MSVPFIPLMDGISYFPASRDPLSADVFLIDTANGPVLFDAGDGEAARSAVLTIEDSAIVLSHFHKDHIGNAGAVPHRALYLSNETQRHTVPGTLVTAPVTIANAITVLPLPNSHAKGSLALHAGNILFIGDALYPRECNGKACYNTGLLKEEIGLIKSIAPEFLIASHRRRPIIPATAAIEWLSRIYRMRDPAETYIPADIPIFDE